MSKTEINLSYSDNTRIPVIGKCIASVIHKHTISLVMFIIAHTNSQAILGADNCEKLQLIKWILTVIQIYQHSFENISTVLVKLELWFTLQCFCDQSSQKDSFCIEKEVKSWTMLGYKQNSDTIWEVWGFSLFWANILKNDYIFFSSNDGWILAIHYQS